MDRAIACLNCFPHLLDNSDFLTLSVVWQLLLKCKFSESDSSKQEFMCSVSITTCYCNWEQRPVDLLNFPSVPQLNLKCFKYCKPFNRERKTQNTTPNSTDQDLRKGKYWMTKSCTLLEECRIYYTYFWVMILILKYLVPASASPITLIFTHSKISINFDWSNALFFKSFLIQIPEILVQNFYCIRLNYWYDMNESYWQN